MKLSETTISFLGKIITGDGGLSPYRSGPELVSFFNQFGFNEMYAHGFPSRWIYAEGKLLELNNTEVLRDVILNALDPRHYFDSDYDFQELIQKVNEFLEYDNFLLKPNGKRWNLCNVNENIIELTTPESFKISDLSYNFINDQIRKCDEKISLKDFDGAITNARTLMEAVLFALEKEFDPSPPKYDGNLPKLYKRIQKHLNLMPGKEGLAECLRQILSGMSNVIQGLSTLRNKMSDSHVISYKPAEHHARLAINVSKTICIFLFETKEYQKLMNKTEQKN